MKFTICVVTFAVSLKADKTCITFQGSNMLLWKIKFRKLENDDVVMLGEKNEYEPLSRKAFVSKMKKK